MFHISVVSTLCSFVGQAFTHTQAHTLKWKLNYRETQWYSRRDFPKYIVM